MRSALARGWAAAALAAWVETPEVQRLREEVRHAGWIVYGARSARGDWDLFRMRPDGGDVEALTATPDAHEAYPQISRDGTAVLYRRLARADSIDGNRHGAQGALVWARLDGGEARVLGGEGDWAWASWDADGRHFFCMAGAEILRVRLADLGVVSRTPRGAFFQQLLADPTGRRVAGVSNGFRTGWSVAWIDLADGRVHAVREGDSCTPDWFPGGARLVLSSRRGDQPGHALPWTSLWSAGVDGGDARLIYAENGRHIYGGHLSPDGTYVVFTGNPREDGDPERSGAPMGLVRLADTPMVGGDDPALLAAHPGATRGPCLVLPDGWEPGWTFLRPRAWPEPVPARPAADVPAAATIAAPPQVTLHIVARLAEIPEGVLRQRPPYNHAAVLRYVVETSDDPSLRPGDRVDVAHYNPWKPRAQASDRWVAGLEGNLESFAVGHRHALRIHPGLSRHFAGGVLDAFDDRPEDREPYWATRADRAP